jgi:hypothetical protein
MNLVDATSRLMNDCFITKPNAAIFNKLETNIPLDQMNPSIKVLKGTAKLMALASQNEVFNEVDGGKDDLMNRIIWFYSKGNKPYPKF